MSDDFIDKEEQNEEINQKRQVKTVHLSINCRLLVYRTCIPNGIQKGVDFGPFFLLHFLKITS